MLAKAFSLRGGERDGAVGESRTSGGGREGRLGMVAGGGMLEDDADVEFWASVVPSLISVNGIRAELLAWLARLVLVGL